jgi:hypothetical protein
MSRSKKCKSDSVRHMTKSGHKTCVKKCEPGLVRSRRTGHCKVPSVRRHSRSAKRINARREVTRAKHHSKSRKRKVSPSRSDGRLKMKRALSLKMKRALSSLRRINRGVSYKRERELSAMERLNRGVSRELGKEVLQDAVRLAQVSKRPVSVTINAPVPKRSYRLV